MSEPFGEGIPTPAPRALRVLIASPPATAQGPLPKHTPLLVAGLRSLGCQVSTADWGSGSDETSAVRRVVSRAKDLLGIWGKAVRLPADVVIIKTGHDWATLPRDILLVVGLRGLARVAVVQFHGSQPETVMNGGRPLFRAATRLLLAAASAIMVLSTEEKGKWEQFRPTTRTYVVKNPHLPRSSRSKPADPTKYEVPGSESAEPPLLGSRGTNVESTVLFVGRLIIQKGVVDLVDAAGRLASHMGQNRFQIVMAGIGPASASIVDHARRLGIADHVSLVGYLDSEALGSLYDRATLLTLPSYHAEGFPTVIAEAMAAGLPIVTTAIHGAADYLEDGVNALLVSPKNPAQLAHAIRTLLEDPELCRRMGQENMRKVAVFAPERVAAEYLEVLLEIAARS